MWLLNSVDVPPTDREGQLFLHIFGSDIVSAHIRDIQWKPHCYELKIVQSNYSVLPESM
jgi:hypothetical protein